VSRELATLRVVGGAIVRGGRCLVGLRRGGEGKLSGWEFPGGKIEPNEAPTEALVRELREELAVDTEVLEQLAVTRRPVPERGFTLELTLYAARLLAGEPVPLEHAELTWVDGPGLATLDWCPADRVFIEVVQRLLEE
jgi:8-oxo-dGTP diphosphatase